MEETLAQVVAQVVAVVLLHQEAEEALVVLVVATAVLLIPTHLRQQATLQAHLTRLQLLVTLVQTSRIQSLL